MARNSGERLSFDLVEVAVPGVILGILAPLGIWRGDGPARRQYLWSMPVDHVRHTLMKVLAGWVWVMGIVAVVLIWALIFTSMTGGALGVSVVRHELIKTLPPGPPIRDFTLHGFTWMWIVPFVAATLSYIAGSIIAVAANHPWRWYLGAAAIPALFEVLNEFSPDFLRHGTRAVTGGRYGFETVVSGITAVTERTAQLLPSGAEMGPDFHAWMVAVAIWSAMLGILLFAVARYRGRTR
jgi:hypothetical protein